MKKDWIARELALEVVVGTFVLTVLLGLGLFTIVLSHDTWLTPKYDLEVHFDEVMGLRDGDSVYVRGMPLGKIKELILEENGIRVVASLDKEIEFRDGYRIMIETVSMLGGRMLTVEQGPAENPPLASGAVLRGEKPYDLMSDAAELVNEVRAGLIEGGVIEDFKVTAAKIRAISERLESGKGTLGRLLSEDDTLYTDLAATMESLKTVTQRLQNGEGLLGRLMSDESTLADDLEQTVTSLRN
ncbi:MAG: MlaD family protein, partial [Verrucomicrobia bacterium]|nr:MlaD family protein [Verrucomicrobiota bacterium]